MDSCFCFCFSLQRQEGILRVSLALINTLFPFACVVSLGMKQFCYLAVLVLATLSFVSGQAMSGRKLRQRQSLAKIDQLMTDQGHYTKSIMAESVTHKAEIDKTLYRMKNSQSEWINKAGDGTSLDRVYNILKKQQQVKPSSGN